MRNVITTTLLGLCLLVATGLTGQNIPRANFSGPMGAQVNTYNGNLYLERTDIAIPNQDLPLGLSFSYNSFRDSTDRGYGYGWSHNYAMRYKEIPEGVVIEREHGRRDTFTISNEQFQAPTGIFDVLIKQGAAYQLRNKYGMTYDFTDASHRYVTSISNTNSNSITLAYTDSLVSQISDASGRSLDLEYSDGHLSRITDLNFPGGRNWNYSYTPGKQLACVANPFGDCQTYTWDGQGRMITYADERGFELSIGYEDSGQVRHLRTCITTVEFAFNEAQGRTVITEQNDGTDQITTHIYDREGKLVRKTGNCCGYDQAYEYNSDNSISQTTDANGFVRMGIYDDYGNTVATRDALDDQQQFTFGDLNRLTRFTDKRGNTTSFGYDNNGNLNRVNQPLDISTNMLYDDGNVTSITNGRGNMTTMDYNENNDLTSVVYPIGAESYEYDDAGNLIRTVDANGNSTLFNYDELNRLVQITDALNNTINYDYDAASNLKSEIDGNGNLKQYEYDAHNRLISVTTPIGITRYGYDALDNLTSITNPEEHTSYFTYDTRSRLTSESDAMGFTTVYEYDNNGNVIARYDANMQTTLYTYDAQNRLLNKTYSGNTDNYAYDANGNLIRASNDNITYEFTYDALNRLTSKYVMEWDKRISYEYDNNGNRTKMTDPDGGETFYVYDENDRLISLLNPFNELTQFRYDIGGRLSEQINFNGTRAIYTYDKANHLLKLSNLNSDNSVISSYEYAYDGNGLRTSMREADAGLNLYTYDEENRLTRVVYADGTTEDYVLDDAGNRTQLATTPQGGTAEVVNYTYDAADRIMTAGDVRYSFDGNGNMIRKVDGEEVTEYEWDGENRMSSYNTSSQGAILMQYDAKGKRISEASTTSNETFFYDIGNLLFKYSLNSGMIIRIQHTLKRDQVLNIKLGNESYSYHLDGSLNSSQLVDINGLIVTDNGSSWNVYGNLRNQGVESESLIQFNNRIKLPAISGLDYRLRIYDTSLGRFFSKDLYRGNLKNPQSLNRFSYVENSPLNYTDPTGLYKEPCKSGGVTYALSGELNFGIVATAVNTIGKIFDEKFLYPKQFSLGLAFSSPDLSGNGEWDLGIVYSSTVGMDIGKLGSLKKLRDYGSAAITIQRTEGPLIYQAVNTIEGGVHGYGIGADLLWDKQDNIVGQKLSIGPGLGVGGGMNIAGGFSFRHMSSTEESKEQSSNCGPRSDGSQEEDKPMQGPLPPLPDLPTPPGRKSRLICIPERGSVDPNEIIGPEGVPDLKWVKGDATLPYTILFENDPELATAPAQRVVLTHDFDDSVNPFSLRIGGFGFGNFFFDVPEDLSYYDTRLDLQDSLGIYLNVIAGIDQEQNQAFWIFESIDPATGFASTLPVDAGFLPVNDTLRGNGEGFVNFTVVPSAAAVLGDRIEAQASIVFDDNVPILTNVELNTIDPERPISRVNDIDTISGGNEFLLSWEATDQGSGLDDVTLFVSTNGGPFLANTEFAGNSTGEHTFTGHPDSVYRFFTIARDLVGNVERMKAVGEPACMTITVASLVNADAGQNNGATEISVTGNSGALSYQWEHDGSISGPAANNLAPGTYRVFVTDASGCTAEAIIEVDQLNSILAPAAAASILKIYPVPSSTEVTLEFYATGYLLSATIHDLNGRVLLRQTIDAIPFQLNSKTFSINNLPAGHYYLRLTSPEGTSSAGRFLKQ